MADENIVVVIPPSTLQFLADMRAALIKAAEVSADAAGSCHILGRSRSTATPITVGSKHAGTDAEPRK